MLRPGTLVSGGLDGLPISRPKERIDHLVQQLDKAKTKIIVPTPALGEALVRAGADRFAADSRALATAFRFQYRAFRHTSLN